MHTYVPQCQDPDVDIFENWLTTEAGLSAVMARLKAAKDAAFVSAFRGTLDFKTNMRRDRQLRSLLNAKKLGAYSLIGYWHERQPDGSTVKVEERSVLVVNDSRPRGEFQAIMLSMLRKFDQEAVLFKQDDKFVVLDRSGQRHTVGTQVSVGKIADIYSTYIHKRNVPFVIEGVHTPGSISGRLVAKHRVILYPHVEGHILQQEALNRGTVGILGGRLKHPPLDPPVN
jgi:hypothetical protein